MVRFLSRARDASQAVRGALLCLTATLCIACDDPAVVAPPSPDADVGGYVTEDLAAQMKNGEFAFETAMPPADLPIISEQRAQELARSYLRTFGPYLREAWEKQHGAAIDLSTLALEQIYYAETPYGPLPADVHPGFRNAYGPYYLATFVSSGVPTLTVAVSAYNTDVSIDRYGRIILPISHGSDFWGQGNSLNRQGFSPITPEQAVALVGRATGVRIARVPELVLLSVTHAPVTAAWRLTLEQPISAVSADSRRREVGEVLVSAESGNALMRASEPQPASVLAPVLTQGSRRLTTIVVAVRRGYAVEVDAITPSDPRTP